MTKRRWAVVILILVAIAASASYLTRQPAPNDRGLLRDVQPSPEEAISILKDGNVRFVKGSRKFARLGKQRVTETALAQQPFATLLACSDSRVPVEHVFDAGIGDLFVVRVAGNVCSDHEIGSIEYGVEHLKTPLVVVLGHTHCGAVTAVVSNADVRGKFPHLAEHIIPAHQDAIALHPNDDDEKVIAETVRCNVRRAIQDLFKASKGIRAEVEKGKVKVVGAVYDLSTGAVEWLPEQ